MSAWTKCLFAAMSAVFGACALPALAIEAPEKIEIGGKIDWVYDYEQGQRLSRESGKPMFVVFRCER